MIIGIDYWNTISAFPYQMGHLAARLVAGYADDSGNNDDWAGVVVISAVGGKSAGKVADDVISHIPWFPRKNVYEVRFNHPRESPALKLAKCQELGVGMFFDDRQDVVDLLNENGILAFKVPRQTASDQGSERT